MNNSFQAVLQALEGNYGWTVNDRRAASVPAYDKSPHRVNVVAQVGDKAVAVFLSGGVNYLRELIVSADGTVHLTDNVMERNHSVGEVDSEEEFFSRYIQITDPQCKDLSIVQLVFLNKEMAAA